MIQEKKVVEIRYCSYLCDKCGSANVQVMNALLTHPVRYTGKCQDCGAILGLPEHFNTLKYILEDGEEIYAE
jgi:hypothetical protein